MSLVTKIQSQIHVFLLMQSHMKPNHQMLPLVPTVARLSSILFHLQEILSSLDCFGLFYIIHEWIGIQGIFTLKHHNTRPWSVKSSLESMHNLKQKKDLDDIKRFKCSKFLFVGTKAFMKVATRGNAFLIYVLPPSNVEGSSH